MLVILNSSFSSVISETTPLALASSGASMPRLTVLKTSSGKPMPQTLFWQMIGTILQSASETSPGGAPGGGQQLAAAVQLIDWVVKKAGGFCQFGSSVLSV